MKEFPGDNEVKMSWGRSIDDMKDAGFIGVDMGAWVIGDADVHLVRDGAVENLGLTTFVKDDHGSAEKRKNQEYTTSVDKGGMRDQRFLGFIGVYYCVGKFPFFSGGVVDVLRGREGVTGVLEGRVPHIYSNGS